MRLFCWPKKKDRDMTKTFEQHADEAQMTDADRIAHAATWDAAIEAAAKACQAMKHDPSEFGGPGQRKFKGFEASRRSGWNAALEHATNAVKALATE
jgi:hypothetical protein